MCHSPKVPKLRLIPIHMLMVSGGGVYGREVGLVEVLKVGFSGSVL